MSTSSANKNAGIPFLIEMSRANFPDPIVEGISVNQLQPCLLMSLQKVVFGQDNKSRLRPLLYHIQGMFFQNLDVEAILDQLQPEKNTQASNQLLLGIVNTFIYSILFDPENAYDPNRSNIQNLRNWIQLDRKNLEENTVRLINFILAGNKRYKNRKRREKRRAAALLENMDSNAFITSFKEDICRLESQVLDRFWEQMDQEKYQSQEFRQALLLNITAYLEHANHRGVVEDLPDKKRNAKNRAIREEIGTLETLAAAVANETHKPHLTTVSRQLEASAKKIAIKIKSQSVEEWLSR